MISFPYLPSNKSISNVLSSLTFGTDYDQISYWDPATSSWRHYVNDSDFNDFTTFEYGKSYEIYVTKTGGVTFTVTGKSPATDITSQVKVGENFISPAVKQPENIAQLLASWNLFLGSDLSDIKRLNPSTGQLELYSQGAFSTFDPGRGYILVGLRDTSFHYGKTETVTNFVYDSTGSRVKKTSGSTTTVYLGKDYEVEGSSSTKYIFLGDNRITTKKSDGTIFFIHSDHINSSNVMTDSAGNQVGLYEYDPYGLTATHTGSAELKHKFTGQEADDSTGLYYYGGRYLDPQLGRFVTADSYIQKTSDPQTFNRYAYARNNPIIFTDPTGNFFFIIAAIIAIAQAVSTAASAVATAYSIAAGWIASGLAIAGIKGTIGTILSYAILGAATGSVIGTADAAISGRSVGRGAAYGAIGGAVGGAASSSLGIIADKMGGAAIMGVIKVAGGSYGAYEAIKHEAYFSAAFSITFTIATATRLANQISDTLGQSKESVDQQTKSAIQDSKGKDDKLFKEPGQDKSPLPGQNATASNPVTNVQGYPTKGLPVDLRNSRNISKYDTTEFRKEYIIEKALEPKYDEIPEPPDNGNNNELPSYETAWSHILEKLGAI